MGIAKECGSDPLTQDEPREDFPPKGIMTGLSSFHRVTEAQDTKNVIATRSSLLVPIWVAQGKILY